MRIPKKKHLFIISALAIILGLSAYKALRTEAPSFMTVSPGVRNVSKAVYATGTIEGKTQVDVGAQASGQITKLYVSTGDTVKKGDKLCEIDPRTQENALKSAEAELEITKATISAKQAEIRKLESEMKRQKTLIRSDATSRQEYEAAQADLDIAKAQLKQYQAQLNKNELSLSNAKTNLGYTSITAPMDGTVYAMVVDEGQTVNAAQTTPTILRLADMSEVKIRTEISEADVVNVKEGMACSFTIFGLPHQIFNGVLGRIEPAPSSYASSTSSSGSSSSSSSSTQNAVYYNADVYVKNPHGVLRIDMTADVTVYVDKRENVLAVPLTALRNDEGTKGCVYVLNEDGKVLKKDVRLGLRDDQYVEVLEGIDEKSAIIIGDDVNTAEASAQANSRAPKRML